MHRRWEVFGGTIVWSQARATARVSQRDIRLSHHPPYQVSARFEVKQVVASGLIHDPMASLMGLERVIGDWMT